MDWEEFWAKAWPWVWPSLLFLAWLALGWTVVRRVLNWLAKRAASTENTIDDAIVPTLRRPLFVGVLVLGFSLWARVSPLPDDLTQVVATVTKAGIMVIVILIIDGAMQSWLKLRARTSRVLATSGGILRTAARMLIFIIGGLMVLTALSVDVTPLIASLGVGSIAIGLALQKTLEDFVAGLLLAADQPVRVGDYVENEEFAGTVLQIGWRSSRLETRDKMHVIVPNSMLAQSKLINRSRPEERVEFVVDVGVAYDSDLAKVGRVAVEVATAVHKSDPRAVADFPPRALVTTFNASSIDFVVWCSAKRWLDHYGLKDAVMRALRKRFDEEGINIPFPIRTLDVPKGSPIDLTRLRSLPAARLEDHSGDANDGEAK